MGLTARGISFNTIWIKEIPEKQKEKARLVGGGKVITKSFSPTLYIFDVSAISNTDLIIHQAFFPGWTAYVDGRYSAIKVSKEGAIQIPLQKGKTDVRVIFKDTSVRSFATILSALSLAIIVFIFIRKRGAIMK